MQQARPSLCCISELRRAHGAPEEGEASSPAGHGANLLLASSRAEHLPAWSLAQRGRYWAEGGGDAGRAVCIGKGHRGKPDGRV